MVDGSATARPTADAAPGTATPSPTRPIVLATISFALSFAAWGLVGGLASMFTSLYSLSASQTALLVAVPVLLGSLARLPMGMLTDRFGGRLVFTALLAVFADDTAAFFVGRAIGRHKLAPSISPAKSWEGFVGGTIAAVLVAFFALYEQDVISSWEALVFGGAIALAATAGDLFESAVKRDLGTKDSGRVLAGHGGVLDRVDSLLWAGPAAYYALLALTS